MPVFIGAVYIAVKAMDKDQAAIMIMNSVEDKIESLELDGYAFLTVLGPDGLMFVPAVCETPLTVPEGKSIDPEEIRKHGPFTVQGF